MAHGCPLNPYDPFEGLYECQPFAKTTQGATAKEIEDDTTAIYTAISAINAMQPVPEYKIRTWRAVKAESAWFNAPPGIDPKSRTARPAPEERRSVAGLERDDPSPRILATLRTKDRVAGLQPPLQTKPTTKSAPRAHTEHADNEYKPQTTPAAAEKTRTTTIRGSAEKCHNTGPKPGLRRAPKRAVRTHSFVNIPPPPNDEEDNFEACSPPSTPPTKRPKRAKDDMLVQRKMLDYFGPRGRCGVK